MKKLFFRALVMSLLMTFQLGFAQKTVSGTVTDTSGVPLPGATVVVQGTNNGVTTNFDGDYSISASEGDVLVVSFVGFESASATVGAASTYDFSLSEGNALEEVVVTALGISREKKSLGYSQQTVSGDVIAESKQVDLNVALTGKTYEAMSAHEKKSLEVAANASLAKSLSYRIYENGKALKELTEVHGVKLEDTPSDYFTEYMAADLQQLQQNQTY
jgi:hypothetical protein